MRKLLILLVIALGFMLSVVSCSKTEEQLPLFNFGSSTYNEPFVGLLKSKPSLLTKSIQYPPFSWVTSDTICLEKTLEITFNEECVRSKSEAIIQFRDSLYKPINGVRIYCNGEIAENGDFTIVADSLVKALSIKCMISPSVGDSIIHGIILIQGKELDVVNGETLQQDNNVIANWECEQEIGWPVLLWLLWTITLLLILMAITVFIKYIYWGIKGGTFIIYKSLPSSNKVIKQSKKRNSSETNKKDEDLLEKYGLTEWWNIFKNKIIKESYGDKNIIEEMHFSEDKKNNILIVRNKVYSRTMMNVKKHSIFSKKNIIIANGGSLSCDTKREMNQILNWTMKNVKYIIDDVFEYKTDKYGRVTYFSGNITKALNNKRLSRGGRPDTQTKSVELMDGNKNTDDGGHIFAHAIHGISEMINYIPMLKTLNQQGGKWANMENKLRNAAEYGELVYFSGHITYPKTKRRPLKIVAITKIGRKREKITFNNSLLP